MKSRTLIDGRTHKAIASLLLLSTTSTFAAPPADYALAGRNQGMLDATSQAKALGRKNGLEDGKNRGYQDGYNECAEQMRQQQRQAGARQGDRDGTVRATTDAQQRGAYDGQVKGDLDGRADGDRRSNQQAYNDATPKGTADGIAQANQTDAAARGKADGKVAGDSAAKTDAQTKEYQPARDAYQAKKYAEPIRSESTIDMGAPAVTAASPTASKLSATTRGFSNTSSTANAALLQARVDALNLVQSAKVVALNGPNDPTIPDVRPTAAADQAIKYCKANTSSVAVATTSTSASSTLERRIQVQPSGRPVPPGPRPSHTPAPMPSRLPSPTPSTQPSSTPPTGPVSEFEKCVDDYKPAYETAFTATFRTEYVGAWKIAFDQQYPANKPAGCAAARKADYRRDYDAAYKQSYDETYRIVYDRVYRNIYDQTYRAQFRASSDQAYNDTYQGHYETHYANAKAAAFKARQDELYTGAYNSAKAAEYSAKYPGYKAVVVAQANKDEQAEFDRIPVRLVGAPVLKDAVRDGIQEPGEKITVDFDLRNFAETAIAARDLDIRAVAKTQGVALPGSVTILTKDLAAKSLNHVTGALDIRLDESALGKQAIVELQISVRGQRLATETLRLTANTLTSVELLETPVVHLGYPGTLRIRVKNNSSLVLPEDATLAISTNMQGVVFSKTSEAVHGLRAGEARDIAFPFSADNYQDGQQVTFVGSLNLASGRRVGILNESRQVPSMQDYQMSVSGGILLGDISGLRKSGKTRIKIHLKNISTRVATGTITLTASITGPDAKNFSFTKGQQDQFSPIAPGQESTSDKMVIKASKSGKGGTFVVEVREAGKLLGVFKQAF